MRKDVIDQLPRDAAGDERHWLALAYIASVEVTSEDESHPIESALLTGVGTGWKASQPGKQTIRLLFDQPQRIRLIKLVFDEPVKARTQEYVLRWSQSGGGPYQDILRQQFNFSPPGNARESELYSVNLDDVSALELNIIPDISGGDARASLSCLQLAS